MLEMKSHHIYEKNVQQKKHELQQMEELTPKERVEKIE